MWPDQEPPKLASWEYVNLDPCRELISVMRDAAKKYFQSPLHVDETKSIFSVIP